MNVFISWSGDRSKAVAAFLKEWIHDIIQSAKPWMSGEDIAAGARWGDQVQKELGKSKFGIICLTRENLDAPWIYFEAGALAKTLEDTYVCPYLIGVEPGDVPKGPLTQFQAKRANKDETWDLVETLNDAMKDDSLPKDQLRRQFDRCWPELKKQLEDLAPTEIDQGRVSRPPDEMIEEILEIVRGLWRSTSMKESPTERMMRIFRETIDPQDPAARLAAMDLGYLKEWEAACENLVRKPKTDRTKDKETESGGGDYKE